MPKELIADKEASTDTTIVSPNGGLKSNPSAQPEDPDPFFDTSHLKQDLKSRAIRGGTITLLGQIVSQAIQLASTMILARLLAPQEFGLIVMISGLTNFATIFKDLGLSMATVQQKQLTHDQAGILFWINALVGLILSAVLIAIAPALVWFYHEPKLLALTAVMASSFVLAGLGAQHAAILQRQMRFAVLSGLSVAQLLITVSTGIIAALAGAGVWALAIMPIVSHGFHTAMVWILCRWRPSLPRRATHVRSLLTFGRNYTAFNVVNYFSRNLDNILIGKFWGPAPVALYSKAYALLLLPIQQITGPISRTAIPTLSLLQNEPDRYQRYYLKALSLIAALTMPAVMYLIVMSEDIVVLLLGEQWRPAGRIFAILGAAALLQPVMNTLGWIYISLGHTLRLLRVGIMVALAVTASFIIGIPHGPLGVATAYTVCYYLIALPCLWYACKTTPVHLTNVLAILWQPLLATLISGGLLLLFQSWWNDNTSLILRVLASLALMIVTYLPLRCLLARSTAPLRDWLDLLPSCA